MKNYFKNVLFVGPHYRQRGGIASVLDVYSKSIPHFNFISTYNKKNAVYNFFYFGIAVIKFLGKMIGNRNIEIVHLHTASHGSFLRKSILVIIARIFGKKTVLHIHSGGFKMFYDKCGRFKFLIRYILNITDELVCLSDEWKAYFDSVTKKPKSIIVNNPVEQPLHINVTKCNNPVAILFLNHIKKDKGLFDLIDFFIENKAWLKNSFKLNIAGAGELEKLEQLIDENDLHELIEYKGWVSGREKDDLIQQNDVFILTSYYEGLPMSILESMSFGKAVIATGVGGIPRIVKPKENGWLVKAGNLDDLAVVFKEIKTSPALLESYGKRSLQIVQDYSPEKVNDKLNEIYHSLLTSSGTSKKISYQKENHAEAEIS
jgi:glycosyltransferase involved in cell wall biosynthesis